MPASATEGQISVTTPGGTSTAVVADEYTYDAPPTVTSLTPLAGPTGGGNTVTINGTNFRAGSTVTFGGVGSPSVTLVSSLQLKAVAPAQAAGIVDVRVTNVGGTSATSSTDRYTYGPPSVTGLNPTAGPTRRRWGGHL